MKVIVPVFIDTESPLITLNGDAVITLSEGDVFTDPGATVLDNLDENIELSITGEVDTASVGTYYVTYRATDSAGKSASEDRTVIVELLVNVSFKFFSGGFGLSSE